MLAGNPRLPALLALLEFDHERDEIDTERAAERLEFEHVDAAVAAFGLADERAFDAKPLGQLLLRQAGVEPLLSQHQHQIDVFH